jgi:hypothetical protein
MKKTAITVIAVMLVIAIAGCSETDVVLKYSQESFDAITNAFPDLVSTSDGYSVLTVDGTTSLKASNDFKAGKDDILIETPLEPFTKAGLDVSKLPGGFEAEGGRLYLTTDYGDGTGSKDNLRDSLFEAVKADRKLLSYHKELDHFGVALNSGKFEWSKDYTKNDKDIVFVIGAEALAELGVDVKNIEGWAFLTMKDAGNDVDLLVKPYDLK